MRISAFRGAARRAVAVVPFRRSVLPFIAVAIMLISARPAAAQLLVSESNPGEPIWAVDLVTNQATPVLSGFGAAAMAVDEANRILYFMSNSVTLYKWNLATPAIPPVLIGNTNNGSSNVSITGLGFDQANGSLIGSRTLGSSSHPEGFYRIDTSTGLVQLAYSIANQSGGGSTYGFDGIDYDSATGQFYGISDPTTSGGGTPGLFRIDIASQQLTQLAPPPMSADPIPDIDGLAAGVGKLFLIEDRAVQTGGRIHVYNLSTNQYEQPLLTPWFFNETWSGGTYIPNFSEFMSQVPEPTGAASLLLLGMAGLARVRGRRNRAAR